MLAMLSWLHLPNAADSKIDDYPCCGNTAISQESVDTSLPIVFDMLFATSSVAVKDLQTNF